MRFRSIDRIAYPRPAIGMLLLSLAVITILFGCGKYEGGVTNNQVPIVEFATTPQDGSVFNSAPVVSWFGRDPDGFVESYSFADIVDPTALADPQTYITQIPQDAWKTTASTSDTIILLTSTGDTTQHIFYLKCTDNRGGESQVIYRRFSRTNQPPDPPQIRNPFNDSWSSNTELTDTLYSIDAPTTLWPGINFNWKASDPDSRVGQTIQLTFKYYLIKAPNDTIQRFVSQDWTSIKTITLSGLETGSYRFEIYSRDDGLTLSRVPGVVYFTVIQPTFDKDILVYMEATNQRSASGTRGVLNVDTVVTYYKNLLTNIRNNFSEYSYLRYNVNDPNDVTFNVHEGRYSDSLPSYAQLSHYKVVLWMQDCYNYPANEPNYKAKRLKKFNDYLQVGGRMMVAGRLLCLNVLPAAAATDTAYPNYAAQRPAFFSNYFGITLTPDPAICSRDIYFWPGRAELIGAAQQFTPFIDTRFDSTKLVHFRDTSTVHTYAVGYDDSVVFRGCPGVDYIQSNGARTVFTFNSNTSDTNFYPPAVLGENSTVIGSQPVTIGNQSITYPPTPTNCLIKIRKNGDITSMSKVWNLTKLHQGTNTNWRGEVRSFTGQYAFITYQYGEPWTSNDTLSVDYTYRATSPRQGRPVCSAYQVTSVVGGTNVSVLLTRTVFSTFPWYFMNQTEVDTLGTHKPVVQQNFGLLLNWLLGPPNYSIY